MHGDNRDAASLMGEALTRMGHHVRVAFDGPAALALVDALVPEVVLLDLGLPGMDGFEVAQRLRRTVSEHIAIIAITGYGQPLDHQRSKDAGFDAHLVKPVDLATVQRAIEQSSKLWH
jgi:CheY-like chemotaxis protein